ncbi:hypothetical protein WJX74_001348 [Apatococcus lobatus]|uniref:Uncharacterized protein n=1 Tax=Apatococcus lobatus TaxID=904363 RepID=A0AAW1RW29_9CHLO
MCTYVPQSGWFLSSASNTYHLAAEGCCQSFEPLAVKLPWHHKPSKPLVARVARLGLQRFRNPFSLVSSREFCKAGPAALLFKTFGPKTLPAKVFEGHASRRNVQKLIGQELAIYSPTSHMDILSDW